MPARGGRSTGVLGQRSSNRDELKLDAEDEDGALALLWEFAVLSPT